MHALASASLAREYVLASLNEDALWHILLLRLLNANRVSYLEDELEHRQLLNLEISDVEEQD